MLPSADILNEFEHGKFVLSNLAAKRAKQLREGAPPLVRIDSNHPLTIALAEIAAGRIKPTLPAVTELMDESTELQILTEAAMPSVGLLLPSLDEVELVPDEDDVDDEPDDDDEKSEKAVSLSDLADDDDDDDADESTASESDDDTLSLTDIAEKESNDENESDD